MFKKRIYFLTLSVIALLFLFMSSCSDMLNRYTGGGGDPDEIIETRGREFFVSFQENAGETDTRELYLFITTDTTTTGQISIAGIAYNQTFFVTAHTITQVQIPIEAMVTSNDVIENLGIHITSVEPVAVYGINYEAQGTDSFLAYPVQTCGREYFCISYETNIPSYPGSYFTITAISDDTTITITPTVTSGVHPADTAYSITMDSSQTYRLYDGAGDVKDITGSRIISDKPIAVFSGHRICQIPTGIVAGNHIVEQLLPVPLWNTIYRTVPFMDKNGDTIRILAADDGTVVYINGTVIATLNAGEFTERIITENTVITASAPVLVAHYANGAEYDSVDIGFGDPSMVIIPSSAQFRTAYNFSTIHDDINSNYINIIVPYTAISRIRLDGSLLDSGLFSEIDENYYGAQVPILQGTHTLSGPRRFGLILYGFDHFEAYSNSGG
ncbi:MAG: IgGFc-binding protein [Spirochaetales bacterium]|nr:IgGFc-binding protein [Spirochaetales bacterium]